MRTVRKHSRYVPEATRKEGMPDLASPAAPSTASRRAAPRTPAGRHFFGWNVSESVFQVAARSALFQSAAFAVYISP